MCKRSVTGAIGAWVNPLLEVFNSTINNKNKIWFSNQYIVDYNEGGAFWWNTFQNRTYSKTEERPQNTETELNDIINKYKKTLSILSIDLHVP